MNKISAAMKDKKAFIGFLTAGDPSLKKTEEYILAMASAGADIIEIGIPFSDPIAEGEVIQKANIRALKSNTTIPKIFDMVKSVRTKTDVPLVFLTYINPVFVYGYEAFFEKCKECDINGIIIPDLPFEENQEVVEIAQRYSVDFITLIAPTSKDRIKALAKDAKGYIYLVSSLGVTGVRTQIETDLDSMLTQIKQVTNTKVAVGFGISTPKQAKEILKSADGVIVGSAIVKIIEQYGENAAQPLYQYVRDFK